MIKIENLVYRYSKQKVLFNGLNLDLQKGEVYGLLGKNGAGKSTLMKTITGLLFPSAGTCFVNNLQPYKRERAFLEQLFFIPEECYLPPLRINRFLEIYAPFYPAFDVKAFDTYLTEFQIDREATLDKLSFGQKKKTFIAFGLAANTPLLIMDEPTNGLDIPSKVQFRKIMQNVRCADKIIMLSTHQVRDLDDLISAVIILDNSKILLHERKQCIAERLLFTEKGNAQHKEALYEEQTPTGVIGMYLNESKITSYLDLEILFNATLSNPNLIHSIFKPTN